MNKQLVRLLVLVIFCVMLVTLSVTPKAGAQGGGQPLDPSQFGLLQNNIHFQEEWWQYQLRAAPLGYIPDGAYARAFEQTQRAPRAP